MYIDKLDAGRTSSKVSNAYMKSHPHATLVLASEVIPQPIVIKVSVVPNRLIKAWMYQDTMPGKAAYEPDMQRYVPKYLAPMVALEILIAKPTRHIESPAKMKGYRILIRSDQIANTSSTMTGTERQLMQATE